MSMSRPPSGVVGLESSRSCKCRHGCGHDMLLLKSSWKVRHTKGVDLRTNKQRKKQIYRHIQRHASWRNYNDMTTFLTNLAQILPVTRMTRRDDLISHNKCLQTSCINDVYEKKRDLTYGQRNFVPWRMRL